MIPALAWWLAGEFHDVRVISASQLDLDEVRELRPDVVVYQTTERLLGAAISNDETEADTNGLCPGAGYVERVSKNRTSITGWVSVNDDGAPPDLRCFRRGEAVGEATFGESRPDVSESTGHDAVAFDITLDHKLPRGALLTGEYAIKNARSGYPLPLTVRLFKESEAELLTLAKISKQMVEARIPATKPRSLSDLSTVRFPVGLTSQDGSATIGRGGFVFLTGGSNVVSERYREPAYACATASA